MLDPVYVTEAATLYRGDCRAMLPQLVPVDAIVTDPPYGIAFMGKDWDKPAPGDNETDPRTGKPWYAYYHGGDYQRWTYLWALQALRAAKPGAYLLAFGGTRMYHRLMCGLEDAGWELRDCIMWVYGTGFPKSLDVSKAVDAHTLTGGSSSKRLRRMNEERPGEGRVRGSTRNDGIMGAEGGQKVTRDEPLTDAAREWAGWGTALKPAWEPIVVCRKPLDGTVAANVLRHGVGGLNIDACRVGTGEGGTREGEPSADRRYGERGATDIAATPGPRGGDARGRWPANVILDEDAAVALDVQTGPLAGAKSRTRRSDRKFAPGTGGNQLGDAADEQNPVYKDSGGASRFFYCAKASRVEREAGLESLEPVSGADAVGREEGAAGTKSPRAGAGRTRTEVRNDHPTVKPLALMRYLCRLVTPPGGVVLDPFAGSGSTLVAARQEGFVCVGIEAEDRACQIAAARLRHGEVTA